MIARVFVALFILWIIVEVESSHRYQRRSWRNKDAHRHIQQTPRHHPYNRHDKERERREIRRGESSRRPQRGGRRGRSSGAQREQPRRSYDCLERNYERGSLPSLQDTFLPDEAPGIEEYLATSTPPGNADDVVYERPEYPKIQEQGILPPQVNHNEETHNLLFMFEASRNDMRELGHPRFLWIRLPYQYQATYRRLECLIYNETGDPFFILNDYFNRNVKARIPIRTAGNHQYAPIPYFDGRTVIFVQNWIVYKHLEGEGEIPEYGFMQATQDGRVPMNAYLLHQANIPSRHTVQSKRMYGAVSSKLAISWPPGICFRLQYNGRWSARACKQYPLWSIHSFYQTQLPDPTLSQLRLPNANTNVQGLDNQWFSCNALFVNRKFHLKNWWAHGWHFFAREEDYFTCALNRFNEANWGQLTAIMAQRQIFPSNLELHNRDALQAAFSDVAGRTVDMRCIGMTRMISVINEIHVCYQRNAHHQYEMINCPPVSEDVSFCFNWIEWPSNYAAIPYVILSLYRMPTQWMRMRDYGDQVSQDLEAVASSPQWFIHSLCPSYQHYEIYTSYIQNVGHLMGQFDATFPQLQGMVGQSWPNLMPNFWRNKYEYCGLPLRLLKRNDLTGVTQYFQTTRNMYSDVNTEAWAQNPILSNLDYELGYDNIRNAIRGYTGTHVSLQCYNLNGRQFLAKVGICYNDALQAMDCPDSMNVIVKPGKEMVRQLNDCRTGHIIIPSHPYSGNE